MNIDPLAEDYLAWSPYNYSYNSPLKFADPTGMGPQDVILDSSMSAEERNKIMKNLGMLTDDKLKYNEKTIKHQSLNF